MKWVNLQWTFCGAGGWLEGSLEAGTGEAPAILPEVVQSSGVGRLQSTGYLIVLGSTQYLIYCSCVSCLALCALYTCKKDQSDLM